jgi:hypothetical protein
MPRPGKTAARGYGYAHRQLRKRLLPLAYGTRCPRCGEVMHPGQELHLGHTDDRSGYSGMEHATCNMRAGARKKLEDDARYRPITNAVVHVNVTDL